MAESNDFEAGIGGGGLVEFLDEFFGGGDGIAPADQEKGIGGIEGGDVGFALACPVEWRLAFVDDPSDEGSVGMFEWDDFDGGLGEAANFFELFDDFGELIEFGVTTAEDDRIEVGERFDLDAVELGQAWSIGILVGVLGGWLGIGWTEWWLRVGGILYGAGEGGGTHAEPTWTAIGAIARARGLDCAFEFLLARLLEEEDAMGEFLVGVGLKTRLDDLEEAAHLEHGGFFAFDEKILALEVEVEEEISGGGGEGEEVGIGGIDLESEREHASDFTSDFDELLWRDTEVAADGERWGDVGIEGRDWVEIGVIRVGIGVGVRQGVGSGRVEARRLAPCGRCDGQGKSKTDRDFARVYSVHPCRSEGRGVRRGLGGY